jgi:protein-L-isoaspartate(D-aspartate) O-methyltransferase
MVERAVEPEFRGARMRLVEDLRAKGIREPAVLRAFERVPRHYFVPSGIRHRAYDDSPLPIGNGQTISQPYIHAHYLELLNLKGTEKVLEVGTGTGYQTALLAHLVPDVFSIERIGALSAQAQANLERLKINNVSLLVGDGTVGWADHAPFDAILVSAGSPSVPQPLVDQLADGGRLLVPEGNLDSQHLMIYTRRGLRVDKREVSPVRFVPLIGSHGWENGKAE